MFPLVELERVLASGRLALRGLAKLLDRTRRGAHSADRITITIENERIGRRPHEALAVGHRRLLRDGLVLISRRARSSFPRRT
jgi:hypothetical protein